MPRVSIRSLEFSIEGSAEDVAAAVEKFVPMLMPTPSAPQLSAAPEEVPEEIPDEAAAADPQEFVGQERSSAASVLQALQNGPLTIYGVSRACGYKTSSAAVKARLQVMADRGEVVERAESGDYALP